MLRTLDYELAGVSARVGNILSMSEWAAKAAIPHRSGVGVLDGAAIERILGVRSKSWDPTLFAQPATIAAIAEEALASAKVRPAEVDAVLFISCSPYEILLDQDAFAFLRTLRIPDHVLPLQLSAGCAGLARAVTLAATLQAGTVLVVAYNLTSCMAGDGAGGVSRHYKENAHHPMGPLLWTSPAIFSDGAAALVLRRRAGAAGITLYSRDSLAFGDAPGFADPLVHQPGGGSNHPPDREDAAALTCFGMNGAEVKRYYQEGMRLNHVALLAARPNYVSEVARIYTHQASPALVHEFFQRAELPADKTPTHARELGNLVSAATIKLLYDDVTSGRVHAGDEVCVSVVGAGPERGAFILSVAVPARTD